MGESQRGLEVWEKVQEGDKTSTFANIAGRLLSCYRNIIKPSLQPRLLPKGECKLLGPIDGIFWDNELDFRRGKVLIVVGTQGSAPEEIPACFNLAKTLQNIYGRRAQARLPIVEDTDLSSKQIEENSLIIIGTPKSNKVFSLLASKLPIKVGDRVIEISSRVYKGEKIGVIMIAPHPLNKDGFILIYCAFHPSLMRNMTAVFRGIQDYVIFSEDSFGGPSAPVLEEGFFLKLASDKWLPM